MGVPDEVGPKNELCVIWIFYGKNMVIILSIMTKIITTRSTHINNDFRSIYSSLHRGITN